MAVKKGTGKNDAGIMTDPITGVSVPPQLYLMRNIMAQDASRDTERHMPLRMMYEQNTTHFMDILAKLESAHAKSTAIIKETTAKDEELYQLQMRLGEYEAKLKDYERARSGDENEDDPGKQLVLQTISELLDRFHQG